MNKPPAAGPRRIDPSHLVRVQPRDPDEPPRLDHDAPLANLGDLFREIGRDDEDELADHLTYYADEDVEVHVYDDGNDFEIRIRRFGTDVEFPTTLGYVYECVDAVMETVQWSDEQAERDSENETL